MRYREVPASAVVLQELKKGNCGWGCGFEECEQWGSGFVEGSR